MAKSKKRSEAPVADPTSSLERSEPTPIRNVGLERNDRERVAQRAYELYMQRGGSHGSDWEDWLAAERELVNASDERGRGKDEQER